MVEEFHYSVGRPTGIESGGGTAIGDAVAYVIAFIEGNGLIALRRVTLVSGDGEETPPWV